MTSNGRNPKPHLLLISPVLPYRLDSGQQMRVHNKLLALRRRFHTTFLGLVPPEKHSLLQRELGGLADEVILLPFRSRARPSTRLWYGLACRFKALGSGLRASNHLMNEVELSPERVAAVCVPAAFDLVLYEYWHTFSSTQLFQPHGIPCVLDMHDMLWRVVEQQLGRWPLPERIRQERVGRYRRKEENAWQMFDALIAINRGEQAYVADKMPGKRLFYAPMGLDISCWPYSRRPSSPPRLAFYGAMTSQGNQAGVFRCLEEIMPLVWQEKPETEFWIVGGNPPADIQRLAGHPQVRVTGFVGDVSGTLSTMSAVLCPWKGQFGFRSRLIEVMATGVPVAASPDAVYGMELAAGEGLLLAGDSAGLAGYCLKLLNDPEWAGQQSLSARRQIENRFSFEATYGALADDLAEFVYETRPA